MAHHPRRKVLWDHAVEQPETLGIPIRHVDQWAWAQSLGEGV
jgi:hypothetical protein